MLSLQFIHLNCKDKMASIKLFFRASTVPNRPGALYFRVIHRRRTGNVNTGIKVFRNEWDDSEGGVVGTRQRLLMDSIDPVRKRLLSIIGILDNQRREYQASDVVAMYNDKDTIAGFISFMRKQIEERKEISNFNAAERLSTVLNSFLSFLDSDELSFDKFDSRLMVRYEAFMKGAGLCPNTISCYMRKLRAIYYLAVEQRLTSQRHPFKRVYTGVAKTEKRAIGLESLKKIKNLKKGLSPLDSLARDMFLFSFYTRGMSIVDMAYLRKSDLKGGILSYRRRKTGQLISVRWEPEMQRIADRYFSRESDYILPLIKKDGATERVQYLTASHVINRHLKKLGQMAGLYTPLTMYVARHTWASVACENDVPVSVISRGRGHDSEKTTMIYLASLDRERIDIANQTIISLLH